jgi:protoheme IX farnesyltransferase
VTRPDTNNSTRGPERGNWRDFVELGKPRLSALVVITCGVGFILATDRPVDGTLLFWTLLGTTVTVFAANALNMWAERHLDALMTRTCHRPLPAGRLDPGVALLFSLALAIAGPTILAVFVNNLTAALGVIAMGAYLFIYTPLKQRSSLCTLAGALCGAIPPVMGWTAATGRLETGVWPLAAILLVWQIPHFMTLAWLYRKDYAEGGFRMLPVFDTTGRVTCPVILLYSLALLPLGLGVTLTGVAGWWYAGGSVVLGSGFLFLGVVMYRQRTELAARRVFLASIIYLPLLLGLMVADRGPVSGPLIQFRGDHSLAMSVAVPYEDRP